MSTPFAYTSTEGRVYTGCTNIGADLQVTDGAPLVVALHGGTYNSAYFDIGGHSLLDNATAKGIPVIALDRPNYMGSSPLETDGSIIDANAEVIGADLGGIWESHGQGLAGIVLVGHSIGGAISTKIAAAAQSWPLLGLAISGCLVRVPGESAGAWAALPPIPMIDLPVPMKNQLMFGPPETLDDDMPASSYPSNTLVPKAELLDITGGWIQQRAEVCGQVRVPVFHRQAEFDHLWVTSQDEIDEFRAGFTTAPSVDTALLPGCGHCIDFHKPSDQFQQAELDFARRCAAGAKV